MIDFTVLQEQVTEVLKELESKSTIRDDVRSVSIVTSWGPKSGTHTRATMTMKVWAWRSERDNNSNDIEEVL